MHDLAAVREARAGRAPGRRGRCSARPSCTSRREQRGHVLGVELAGVQRHRRRRVARADDRHALAHGGLARARSARSCRPPRRPGRRSPSRGHRGRPSSAVTRRGAARPGTSAVVMTTSEAGDVLGQQLLLPARRLLGELLRVAALALAALGQLDLEERRAEALDLLAHGGPDVERADRPRRGGARWRSPAGPATPAPSTSTRAGRIVPAAVISIGKNLGSASAASSAAR